jgi:hypothetical protein
MSITFFVWSFLGFCFFARRQEPQPSECPFAALEGKLSSAAKGQVPERSTGSGPWPLPRKRKTQETPDFGVLTPSGANHKIKVFKCLDLITGKAFLWQRNVIDPGQQA